MRGQPGALVLERGGVAGPVPGPRERHHRDTVLGATHPGGVSLQIGRDEAQIQRPPPPTPLAPVLPRTPPPAAATAARRPLREVGHGPPAHPHPRRRRHSRPPCARHRAASAIASRSARRLRPFVCRPSNSRKPRREAACTAFQQVKAPPETSEEPTLPTPEGTAPAPRPPPATTIRPPMPAASTQVSMVPDGRRTQRPSSAGPPSCRTSESRGVSAPGSTTRQLPQSVTRAG